MSNFQFVDKYKIRAIKDFWGTKDHFIAECLNIELELGKYHLIDIRIVSKRALVAYLEAVFNHFYTSPLVAEYRTKVFNRIKIMYEDSYNEFVLDYKDSMEYDRPLRQHQIDTLFQSVHRKVNLWALDMGLGKTLTAATQSKISKASRTIIICPAVVKYNWLQDLTTNWGFDPFYWTIIDSQKSKCTYAFEERFVVLNFEQVEKNMDYLCSSKIDHIIGDECHYFRNLESRRSKAFRQLLANNTEARITLLSGTPLVNRINDMFAYLAICHHPLGKNKKKFIERYTSSGSRGNINGAKNLDELRLLTSNLMIRLKSEDCIDLPPISIEKYYFRFDELQDEYNQEIERLRELKKKYDSSEGKEKAQTGVEIKANIHTMNRIVATSKVPQIKELIDYITSSTEEKVIVFSGYKAPLNRLEEILGESCVKIDGSIPAYKRQVLIDEFISNPKKKVFLGNMVAAGIGINLVNARHVIYMNFPFTPDQLEQSQKRAHRSGQKRKVFVYYTIAKGTIDDHIYSLMSDKADDINQLIDGDHKGVINYSSIMEKMFSSIFEEV